MKNVLTTTLIFLCFVLASCSSIKSTASNEPTPSAGLNYYMPKKDLIVIVTVAESKVSDVSISASPVYPDLTKKFVLSHNLNLIGKNTMDIGINEAGLLTSSKSTTVSNVNEVFKSLGTNAGLINGIGMYVTVPSVAKACENGKFTYVFSLENAIDLGLTCNLTVSVKKKGENVSNVDFNTDN
jgi:hypothetical protein